MNNIEDIEAEVEEVAPSNVQLPRFISDDFKTNLLQNKVYTPKIKFNYNGYRLDITEKSQGLQKLFALFFPFFDIIENGKTFICDEFETHLHPLIVRELIRFFKVNSVNSQFIFTTNDVNLLDFCLFRRDQIWFAEKNKDGDSRIFSLEDFKIRFDKKILNDYLDGRYGAIPHFKGEDSLADLVDEFINK